MPGTPDAELERAVAEAVRLVNAQPGHTAVRLQFVDGEVDLVASAASLQGEHFSFSAGFETVDGRVSELARIRAEVIGGPGGAAAAPGSLPAAGVS